MRVLHVNDKSNAKKIDEHIKKGDDVFILVHMNQCPPCMATLPEWKQLEHKLSKKHASNDKLAVIDVEQSFLPEITLVGSVDGFPTMKHISNRGDSIKPYESGKRDVQSLANWIEASLKDSNSESDSESDSDSESSSPKEVYEHLKKQSLRRQNSLRGGKRTKTRFNRRRRFTRKSRKTCWKKSKSKSKGNSKKHVKVKRVRFLLQ